MSFAVRDLMPLIHRLGHNNDWLLVPVARSSPSDTDGLLREIQADALSRHPEWRANLAQLERQPISTSAYGTPDPHFVNRERQAAYRIRKRLRAG